MFTATTPCSTCLQSGQHHRSRQRRRGPVAPAGGSAQTYWALHTPWSCCTGPEVFTVAARCSTCPLPGQRNPQCGQRHLGPSLRLGAVHKPVGRCTGRARVAQGRRCSRRPRADPLRRASPQVVQRVRSPVSVTSGRHSCCVGCTSQSGVVQPVLVVHSAGGVQRRRRLYTGAAARSASPRAVRRGDGLVDVTAGGRRWGGWSARRSSG